jgi:hypothetical protein
MPLISKKRKKIKLIKEIFKNRERIFKKKLKINK